MAQIKSIFNFLKDYNELSNPVITEIDNQKWSMKISNLPKIKEVWSAYNIEDFDGLKILEVKRPVLEPCPVPDESIIEWIDGSWEKLGVEQVRYEKVIARSIHLYKYACSKCDWIYDPQVGDEDIHIPVCTDFDDISEEWVCPNCSAKKTAFRKANLVACYKEEFFNEDENRLMIFDKWIAERTNWRIVEIPKQQGLDLYNKLFKLYSEIKKESESVELILGDGRIRWTTDLKIIDHPVLLQNVHLEFDADKPSFIVKCDELRTELYTPMLRIIPSINQLMLSNIIQDIEKNAYHIADTSNTKGLFQRLINVLDEKGKCVESFESNYNGPMIMTEPILFLRKRTLGFSMFIDKIIEEIESNEDAILPDFFENMIGNHKEQQEVEIIGENWNQSGIDEDVLLTLPANNEQLKIIKYLNNYGAVLVQGPPGTGKTHTIANLIGHLLSQGSSVLVTSHTEKALTVLKEKVYKDKYNKDINLQSLCISLLSSSSQKKEMDDAINEIAAKGTSLDLHESKKKIERLEIQRKDLINKSKTKNQELLQIRSLEYKDIVFANQTVTPINAAKFIKDGYGKYDYIPGATKDDTLGLSLSVVDFCNLYHSNLEISTEEENLLSKELPTLEFLWSFDEFKLYSDSYIKLTEELIGWNPKLVLKDNVETKILSEISNSAILIYDDLNSLEEYQLAIIAKTIKDGVYTTLWTIVFKELDELMENYEQYRKILFDNDICIPKQIILEESVVILNEIIDSGKEIPVTFIIGVTKPKWKRLRDGITNNKRKIENKADFEKVRAIIIYELKRNSLLNKINKLLLEVSENAAINIEDFEQKVKQHRKKIQSSLNWHEQYWIKLTQEVQFNVEDIIKFEELCVIDIDQPIETISERLKSIFIPDLSKRCNSELLNKLTQKWDQYAFDLNGYKVYKKPFDLLIRAVNEKDVSAYEEAYYNITELYAKRKIFSLRNELIRKLKINAPIWAHAIENRNGIHGEYNLPEDIELAWKWRQLTNQLERIDRYDPNMIQKELRNINDLLMQNARRLAYEKAWHLKIKNKTQAQTQAIEGWRATIRQVGKGTGKSAPMLLKKARELMPLCQSAIPVWIMSLNRVAENFDPQKNKFDVVIIDEASQAGILSLSALYLGKKIIIVGDDEQVSPDTVGIKTEEINALIEQHLQGIPNNHLFNGKTSVYDMAKASGFKPLMLTEHFRCLPEIIEFSNQLSYNGRIKPLRDASGVAIKPAVIEYRVPNAYKSPDKINKTEAQHIAAMICACVENEAYKGKTFGIISLLGQEQAYEIDRLLQLNLDPKEYESRKIQCGTASQFQGDERDVIFLSIVEGPSEKGGPVRLLSEDGNNDLARKRYNVAASRAKDQMWVVHSLNPEIDLKPDDIRLRLIKHAMNPSVDKDEERLKHAESDFEKQVMKSLLNQGYIVIPQWKVGTYRIDMVIEDGNKHIALECDGEKWHTQDDLPNDLKRQAILERLGWKFIRIRGSQFYRNPDDTMKWVFEELENNEIRPNYLSETEYLDANMLTNDGLIDSIKRRAEQIRLEWNGEFINEVDAEADVNDIQVGNVIDLINSEQIQAIEEETTNPVLSIMVDSKPKDEENIGLECKQINFYAELGLDNSEQLNILDLSKSEKVVKSPKKRITKKNGDRGNEKVTSVKKNIPKPIFDFRKK
ncbi:AAA domain-containing protein [Clostridium estertheticum]|uniref:AAA domain-containing protein n=1 Tax=Clostridium estertheticum TaxID=238834 RepID=UPI0013E9781C|nr:AAA domain-containing protein [Clostridium estertheticum]